MGNLAYCATWANGVCQESDRSAILQESSLDSIRRLLSRVSPVVIGSSAYKLFRERGIDFSNNQLVLLSSDTSKVTDNSVQIYKTPAECIAALLPNIKKNETILIAGGLKTLNSFMQLGLIDELIIDIEPGLTASPQTLFTSLSKQQELSLIGVRKVGSATIQLHYRVPNKT
jgi:dihydrofolate reductase